MCKEKIMKKDNTNQNTSFSMKIFTEAKEDGMCRVEFTKTQVEDLKKCRYNVFDGSQINSTEDSDKRVYRFPNLDGSSYVYKDRDDINNLLFSRYKNKINGSIIPKDSFTLNDSAATLRPSIYCDVIWDEVTERIISLPTGLVDIIDGERMTNGYV